MTLTSVWNCSICSRSLGYPSSTNPFPPLDASVSAALTILVTSSFGASSPPLMAVLARAPSEAAPPPASAMARRRWPRLKEDKRAMVIKKSVDTRADILWCDTYSFHSIVLSWSTYTFHWYKSNKKLLHCRNYCCTYSWKPGSFVNILKLSWAWLDGWLMWFTNTLFS